MTNVESTGLSRVPPLKKDEPYKSGLNSSTEGENGNPSTTIRTASAIKVNGTSLFYQKLTGGHSS